LLNGFVIQSFTRAPRAGHRGRPAGEHFALSRACLGICLQGRHAHGRSLRFESDDDILIAKNALAQVGAAELSDRWMDQISGGEKQRVILARAGTATRSCCSTSPRSIGYRRANRLA